MRENFWRLRALMAMVAFIALIGGSVWADEKLIEGGKAQDFKSKAFDIKEKSNITIHLSFPAGKEAAVTVRGAKKTDIHLYVYDEAKKTVTKDDSPGPNCDVKFTPAKAVSYTLEIRNEGPGDNSCTLKVDVAK